MRIRHYLNKAHDPGPVSINSKHSPSLLERMFEFTGQSGNEGFQRSFSQALLGRQMMKIRLKGFA